MKATRLLLPFTHGVDMNVLEYAVLLAKSHNATLIPLALIRVPERQWLKGARLEHIQQSKDFLEAVRVIAARHGVPVERFEVLTSDVVQSINVLVHQMECEGIVLFVRGSDNLLLSADEVEHLMKQEICTRYLIRLSAKRNQRLSQLLREHLSSWLPGSRKRTGTWVQMQQLPEGKVEQGGTISPHSDPLDLEATARP